MLGIQKEVTMRIFTQIITKTLLPTAALVCLVLIACVPFSCRATEESLQLLSGDFTVPKITGFQVVDNTHLRLEVSKPVKVDHAVVVSTKNDESTALSSLAGDDLCQLVFTVPQSLSVGESFLFEGAVFDANGNSLTFSIPFTGFNGAVPRLVFSEVRTKTGTAQVNGATVHRSEFVELYALSGGNLSGLELYAASTGDAMRYLLPPIDVSAGEYIVVHFRQFLTSDKTPVNEGERIDELGDDFSLATATDHCPTARDLWGNNLKRFFGDADIIVLRNTANGEILDAFVYAPSDTVGWNDSYETLATQVCQSGVWQDADGVASCDISSAVKSDLMTTINRTASRRNIAALAEQYEEFERRVASDTSSEESFIAENSAAQWAVGTSKDYTTPGLPNVFN